MSREAWRAIIMVMIGAALLGLACAWGLAIAAYHASTP